MPTIAFSGIRCLDTDVQVQAQRVAGLSIVGL